MVLFYGTPERNELRLLRCNGAFGLLTEDVPKMLAYTMVGGRNEYEYWEEKGPKSSESDHEKSCSFPTPRST